VLGDEDGLVGGPTDVLGVALGVLLSGTFDKVGLAIGVTDQLNTELAENLGRELEPY
jgi:hypothetical protein